MPEGLVVLVGCGCGGKAGRPAQAPQLLGGQAQGERMLMPLCGVALPGCHSWGLPSVREHGLHVCGPGSVPVTPG